MSSKRDLEILFDLLTELEKLGCFEIKTKEEDRWKIAKEILRIIEEGKEDELLEKTSGRWL